jgi:hypothetical protein
MSVLPYATPSNTEEASRLKWPADARQTVERSLLAAHRWLEENEFAAYDPFEGLSSGLRPLTLGTKFGRQVLVQIVRRSPVNLRPFIGIRPTTSTKGMGFLAQGYLRWSEYEGSPALKEKAISCYRWLAEHSSSGYSGSCWGNHFDYQTRLYYAPAGTPTVVWSSLIAKAFLEAYEKLGDPWYLTVARGTCEFILRDLPRPKDSHGFGFSYIPLAPVRVHNANCLAAALLARVYKHTQEPELYQAATDALSYAVSYQEVDGSWTYGPDESCGWTDSWHTAYVLDSLHDYALGTGDSRFEKSCRRGWEYYLRNFFLPDGTPKYYWNGVYPIDIQSGSQAIETLCRFQTWNADAVPLAVRVALWTIEHMQDRDGHFYFQRRRFFVSRTPTFHWGQATMVSALSVLLLHMRNEQN